MLADAVGSKPRTGASVGANPEFTLMRLAEELRVACTEHNAAPGDPCRWRITRTKKGPIEVRWYCTARAGIVGKTRKSGPCGAQRRKAKKGA